MTLTVLEASEYALVRVQACDPCRQEQYAPSHLHGPVAEERAIASSNPNQEWDTLGIHLAEKGPTVHWYVGQVWLREPDVVLQVTPKVTEASAFRMYIACLGDPEVSARLNHTIRIGWEQRSIPLEDKVLRLEITPLLIAQYLHVLFELCRRHLRVAFRKVEANLQGTVRGRPVVTAQVRQNVARGRLDRVVCQFQILSIDTLANQILRAALEQSLKYLRRHAIGEPLLWRWASYSLSTLAGVTLRRIAPLDFKGLHYAGFLTPYREPHRWARLILQLLGYDPREVVSEPFIPGLPPFALNMNELFERYCEVRLRARKDWQVWAGYGDRNLGKAFAVRPDFLVVDRARGMGWIVDAKYKPDWSWNEDHRHDVYQLMVYSRHRQVLQKLQELLGCTNEPLLAMVVLFPHGTFLSQSSGLCDLTGTAPNDTLNAFQLPLTKCPVPLPAWWR